MIEHVSIGVTDLARSGAFYDAILGALGYVRLVTHVRAITYGRPGARDEAFAILAAGADAKPPGQAWHVAFQAPDRGAVALFHTAALERGGTDEGGPGIRESYAPSYYAAFVRDPDGNRLEAVCHEA